jgi:hypothetical protein
MIKTDINESLSKLGFTENCIVETILVTSNLDGSPNIAPMGITKRDKSLIVKPFKTSQTYENLRRGGLVIIHISHDPLLFLNTAFKQEFSQQTDMVKDTDASIQAEITGLIHEDDLRASFRLSPSSLEIQNSAPTVFSRGRAEAIELVINATRLQVHKTENRDHEVQLIVTKIRENIEIINRVSVEGTSEHKVVEAVKSLSKKWGVDI